ncbi:MAG: 5-formyltetrahydrofolate cyclo-ligase [Treponema sp.]|nr:5-formyltetrahydrofolate cyclo-ligase [Treponema sp.]
MTKQEIRSKIKQLVNENQAVLHAKSQDICKKIVTSDEYLTADIILAYMALDDEVDLGAVIISSFVQEKKIAVPKVNLQSGSLDFYYFDDTAGASYSLNDGYYGIKEPDETKCKKLETSSLNGNVLILVPGRSFTDNGDRLGRGKGFYDKFLSELKSAVIKNTCSIKTAGVCFDFQILQNLPVTENDVKMNLIFQG